MELHRPGLGGLSSLLLAVRQVRLLRPSVEGAVSFTATSSFQPHFSSHEFLSVLLLHMSSDCSPHEDSAFNRTSAALPIDKVMEEDSYQSKRVHPLVLRIIEEMRCPSPGECPKDLEQPKSGSLRELKSRMENRRRTDSCLCLQKKEIEAQVKLGNTSLMPAPIGWSKHLSSPSMSHILLRRKLRSLTEGASAEEEAKRD